MSTTLTKVEKVFQVKKIGELKEKIVVPNLIIQDTNLINNNNQQLKQITTQPDYTPIFQNSNKTIKIKRHQITFNNTNYFQDYERLKNTEKERFKNLREKKSQN